MKTLLFGVFPLLFSLASALPIPSNSDELYEKMSAVGELMRKSAQRNPETREFLRNAVPILVDDSLDHNEKIETLAGFFIAWDGGRDEEMRLRTATWVATLFHDVEVEFVSRYFPEQPERGGAFFRKCLHLFRQDDYLMGSLENRSRLLRTLIGDLNKK